MRVCALFLFVDYGGKMNGGGGGNPGIIAVSLLQIRSFPQLLAPLALNTVTLSVCSLFEQNLQCRSGR